MGGAAFGRAPKSGHFWPPPPPVVQINNLPRSAGELEFIWRAVENSSATRVQLARQRRHKFAYARLKGPGEAERKTIAHPDGSNFANAANRPRSMGAN